MLVMLTTACSEGEKKSDSKLDDSVLAGVDGVQLRIEDVMRDMPIGITATDSTTFMRMYVENWVLNRLKMKRAEEVLSSSEDIERLVEGYRQSLIMRQLDQYYIDKMLDTEITDKQISAYYRAHSAAFKLDHNVVQGVVVKVPKGFRNTSTLQTAITNSAKDGNWQELDAMAEKHSLSVINMTSQWVSYSDFLSNLPTERSQTYTSLLSKSGVQQMTSDDATFYFIITEVAHKGEVAPIECVEDDIRRRLYTERRADIVKQYEMELKREGIHSGRVTVIDTLLMESMGYTPKDKSNTSDIPTAVESIDEDIPLVDVNIENED